MMVVRHGRGGLIAMLIGVGVTAVVAVVVGRVATRGTHEPPVTVNTAEMSSTAVDLPPIPDFPLESMEPTVRKQFAEAGQRLASAPEDPPRNGRLGMLYHAYGFHALAEPCYRRASALAPDEPRWHHFLGLVLKEQGRWDAAAVEFDEVLANLPDYLAAILHRADVDRMRTHFDDALRGYRRVIEIAPGAAQAQCGAGRVLVRRGEFTSAVEHLQEAIRLAPEYGTARYVLGQALRKLGRSAEAMQQLELAERQAGLSPPIDDPLLREVATLRTGAIEALHRGIDLLQRGAVEAAIDLFQEAVRIDPDLAEAHSQLGAALLTDGDLNGAQQSLRRALQLDPDFVDAVYNLGLVAHQGGDYTSAVERFTAAVAIRPQHFDAHLGLGTDLSRLGRTEEALEHLRAALRLRPDDARPYKRMGSALSGLHRYEEAIDALRRGVERLPEDASIVDRLAWELATCPRPELRDADEAIRLAEAVCDRTRHLVPRALDTLAAALASAGRYPEAVTVAEEALRVARDREGSGLTAQIESRLARYRDGLPYRQHSP